MRRGDEHAGAAQRLSPAVSVKVLGLRRFLRSGQKRPVSLRLGRSCVNLPQGEGKEEREDIIPARDRVRVFLADAWRRF